MSVAGLNENNAISEKHIALHNLQLSARARGTAGRPLAQTMVAHRKVGKKSGISRTTAVRLCRCKVPRIIFSLVDWLFFRLPQGITRDLDCVELFSGQGNLTKEFRQHGMSAACMDIRISPLHDLASTSGFLKAVLLTMRLKVGGLLFSGTPCSTWVFVSRGSTGRSRAQPLGRVGVDCVATANVLTARVALLFAIACCRGAVWVNEQPSSSLMEYHPAMCLLKQLCALPRSWFWSDGV